MSEIMQDFSFCARLIYTSDSDLQKQPGGGRKRKFEGGPMSLLMSLKPRQ
jgi:hypothetical protein